MLTRVRRCSFLEALLNFISVNVVVRSYGQSRWCGADGGCKNSVDVEQIVFDLSPYFCVQFVFELSREPFR